MTKQRIARFFTIICYFGEFLHLFIEINEEFSLKIPNFWLRHARFGTHSRVCHASCVTPKWRVTLQLGPPPPGVTRDTINGSSLRRPSRLGWYFEKKISASIDLLKIPEKTPKVRTSVNM